VAVATHSHVSGHSRGTDSLEQVGMERLAGGYVTDTMRFRDSMISSVLRARHRGH
jgi:hypothetical protein